MEDEDADEEVEVITTPPLLFPRTLTTTSHSHLVPAGVHIPGFRQFRQPVVMMPVTVTGRPAARPSVLAPSGSTKPSVAVPDTVVSKVAMGLHEGVGEEGLPIVPEPEADIIVLEEEMDTQEGVMEIPTSEGLRTPGVHLDVVGSDAVVMVDTTLLTSLEEPDRESRTQRLSTFLSTRG